MDLNAYVQISKLEPIAKANNINIIRIRGYRLMKDENPINIKEMQNNYDAQSTAVYNAVGSGFTINSDCLILDESRYDYIDKLCPVNSSINWNIIHGKKRKVLKYHFKHIKKNIKLQYEMWNKYAGRDDVLYIHAKIGSYSWSNKKHYNYKNEPWYLDSIDDTYDPVYCDIYAKIDPDTIKEIYNGEN